MVAKTTAVAKAKSSKSTAVATLNYEDEVAALAKRLQTSTADRIKTSNAKIFEFPDKSEAEEIDCIVLDFVAFNRYYPSAYDENQIVPPDCFAIGFEPSGLIASDNSPNKQCGSCAGCALNQFKSAPNGKGKACSNTRLLAVIIPPDPENIAVGDDLSDLPIYTISVSPTAITSFDSHVNKVANAFRKPVRTVITRITFAQDSKYASLRFSAVAPAGRELELLAQSRLEEARKRLFTEPDVSAFEAANDSTKKPAKPAPRRAAGGRR